MSSIPLGSMRWGTNAARLAATFVPGGTVWYETDTGLAWLRAVNGGGALVWEQLGDSSAPAVNVVASPAVDEELVVALPDVALLTDGTIYNVTVAGTSLGSAVAVLTASAGQTIGAAGLDWYRLHEGGAVVLRADQGTGGWYLVAQAAGVPQDLALSIDAASGSDANPGTVARPLLTAKRSFALAAEYSWRRDGEATVVGSGSEDIGAQGLRIPGGSGAEANPFLLTGTTFAVAPGFAASYVTNGAGLAASDGPPVQLMRFAIAATPAFGSDAAVGYFLRVTSGPLTGQRFPVAASTTTTVDVGGGTVAPGAGVTFVIEEPAYSIDSGLVGALFEHGTSQYLVLTGLSLGPASGEVGFTRSCIALRACKCGNMRLSGSAVYATTPPVLGSSSTQSDQLVFDYLGAFPPSTAASVSGDSSSLLSATGMVLTGMQSIRNQSQLIFTRCVLRGLAGGDYVHAGSELLMDNSRGFDVPLVVSGGGSVEIDNFTVTNTTAGRRALTAERGATALLTNIRGTTEAATTGVAAFRGATVVVTDPNVGTTVSGGAGVDATVGVLGTKTWAAIDAGAYADINDNAGAPVGGTGATVSE